MSIKKIALFFVCILPINIFASNKAPIDITIMDISALSKALNDKIITSEQLVNLYLDRINTYDEYNAIITINHKAIDEAKKLDLERKNGKIRSAMHGIPIIVKDNIDVVGMPTTAGAKALSDNYPKEDAFAIKKLKEAGAIIIAKSNMSEFAFQANSSRSTYGTVKNAYNIDYSSYGSSGGSAVSVALNFAPAALGTDTNSSVRVPASAANIIGYRPTLGLISRSGVLPYDPERDTIGLLTKSINDSIILTNIIMGYDQTDTKTIKNAKHLKKEITALNSITIGIPKSFLKGNNNNSLYENKEIYEEIYDLMLKAISKLENNGAKIVYLENYYTYTEDNYSTTTYSGYLFCDAFNKYIKNHEGKIKSFQDLANSNGKLNNLNNSLSNCNTNNDLTSKNNKKNKYRDYLTKIYQDNNLDVIIYPTTKNKLLKNGTSGLINLSAHAASTVGFPAINMPLGFDQDNLPYGVEFMALNGEDNKLLNIASMYESLNKNSNLPSNAPKLYHIDQNVTLLVSNYKNNKRFLNKRKWLDKVDNYFQTYNQSNSVIKDAINLNREYSQRVIYNYILKIFSLCIIYFFLKPKVVKYIKYNRGDNNDRLYHNRQ